MVRKFFFLAATTAFVSANAQSFNVDGHEAVDLGLSVLWATCNVGADNPEKDGKYFAWGETEGYFNFSQHYFSWENYFDTTDGGNTFTNYNGDRGHTELTAENDAATQNWSKNWRMPTQKEFADLKDENKIHSEWVTNYKTSNVKGRVFFKKKEGDETYDVNSDAHIFLPAAGYLEYNNESYDNGFYWSSSLDIFSNELAWAFLFDSKLMTSDYNENRCYGFSVRPVCEKSVVTKLNYVEKDNANTVCKTIENGQIVIVKNGVKYNLKGQKI